ncbi:cytochrome c [Arenibacter sp. GZD96]|uniref:c-type cytochrome n=1 Tax=Aurantibrevibacter litoralis TaxID=3106030 RepID=UPI002AFDEE78|nr:cytochrome c [Arenibacter sp. GZD-96]MEA1784847.1 cytochrome c [Arenibacter sp. GZD-96]
MAKRTTPKSMYSIIVLIWISLFACNDTPPVSLREKNISPPEARVLTTWPASFGFGRTAKVDEIKRIDIDIRPDGKGLPAGQGTALEGKSIYVQKCASCHGLEGEGGTYGRLVGHDMPWTEAKTIGNYWPYATTIYDYINRSMPFNAPGSLTADEVYSITAFLLAENKIIDENQVMDSVTLPKVIMPAKTYFVVDDRKDGKEIR